ncbi:MAG TPA: patatin-like phospholipase family protein [Anaeromyxobacteraceae bacterium]|nr:patatin-like phospholipase family protein [Anaeromyxobacteraceae bacterium]
MRVTAICLLAILSVLTACRSAPAPVPAQPPVVSEPPKPPPQPRIALVLGGGAARGFAHVGVIRALEQEKIPIDLVVGTSVGSLIGALYAAEGDSFELEWAAFQLQKDDLFDYGVMTVVMGMGLAKGERLEQFVRNRSKVANIEDLKIPFAAVATDLNWGAKVVLDRGPVARAVRASSAIPGVFQPVQVDGKLLIDGGVVDNIPVSVARAKGADIVVAVDIGENVGRTNITNLVDVTLQATSIMFTLNAEHAKKDADVLIAPRVGDVTMLDFSQKKRCMQAGIEAARVAAPKIRAAVERWVALHAGRS